MEDAPRKFFRLSPGREVRLKHAYYITCDEAIKDDDGNIVSDLTVEDFTVTEDGRVVGVRLTRVAQDSLLTEAGLRSGDVLTNINGTEIDGMATLISLWPRLQGASSLQADGLRDGRPFSISLDLE